MIELSGNKSFPVPVERLYPELADLTRLVQSLPDVKTVKAVSEDTATIVVAPGLSFIKGELETTIQRTESNPPTSASLQVASKGIGTTVKVFASFTLAPQESGSELAWKATVTELGGLLKLVPGTLLKGAAQKVIEGWLTSLASRLS